MPVGMIAEIRKGWILKNMFAPLLTVLSPHH